MVIGNKRRCADVFGVSVMTLCTRLSAYNLCSDVAPLSVI